MLSDQEFHHQSGCIVRIFCSRHLLDRQRQKSMLRVKNPRNRRVGAWFAGRKDHAKLDISAYPGTRVSEFDIDPLNKRWGVSRTTEMAINRVKTGTESMYQRWRGTPYWKASQRYSSEKTDDLESALQRCGRKRFCRTQSPLNGACPLLQADSRLSPSLHLPS